MNLKSKIISLVIIFTVFVGGSAYSQGFFKNENSTSGDTSTGNGVLRAGDNPGDPGPGDPSTSPVGEGLAILSLLSGGYFMLKRRNSKK
ncbi:hypothetical protein AGMMS50239_13590 [Bacteroidia bacterium]|nr:hypothetical protein AGMMS50239_13590 [Bacteroidia bacterium]GHV30706.1 hypothetical protein FACS1894177_03760 [Bacteroidia bacterium]